MMKLLESHMGKGGGCVPSKTKKSSSIDDDPPITIPEPHQSIPMQIGQKKNTDAEADSIQKRVSESNPEVKLRIFIVFYSMYRHVEGLAKRMKKGVVGVEGVEGALYRALLRFCTK